MATENKSTESLKHGDAEAKIEKDNMILYIKKGITLVLPYTVDEDKILDKIGVLEEKNIYSILHSIKTKKTHLKTVEKLLEEFIKIEKDPISSNKIQYLGEMYLPTFFKNTEFHLYCVDITDIELKESESEFKLIKAKKVLSSADMLLSSSFLKLYLKVFKIAQKNNKDNE